MISLKRLRRRLYRAVVRLEDSPHVLAWGLALGVVIGCVVPPGLQLAVAGAIALLCRVNVITALAGTWVSNPLTYLPLYLFTCKVGALFLKMFGHHVELKGHVGTTLRAALRFDLQTMAHELEPILASWTCGGLIVGLAGAVPAYYLMYLMVIEIRKLRRFAHDRIAERRNSRAQAEAHEQSSAQAPHIDEPDEEAPDEQPPPKPE